MIRRGYIAKFVMMVVCLWAATAVAAGSDEAVSDSGTTGQPPAVEGVTEEQTFEEPPEYDRYDKSLGKEGVDEVFLKSFTADAYLASANALTEHGEVYCVDGRSNRTAAMLYGPKQVILIVSWDKIVPDLVSAILRVKDIAAPANATRLKTGTYCTGKGKCMQAQCDDRHLMALPAGACEHTICSNYVVFSQQQVEGRMKVLIVGESLGY